MIVGLTGGLASGKDLVAAYLKEFGAEIIDADTIAREIIEPGEEAYNDIVRTFDEKVVKKDGRIDRAALGEIVFSDRALLKKLNDIMLPRIIEEEKRRIEALHKENREAIIVINAPLLIESGHYREMDRVIVVDIDEELQIERAGQKGYTREAARARMKCQITREKRLRSADFIIDNSGNRQTTKDRTRKVFTELKRAT
ncbi:MAG: dephospho-CoA kinase [Zetaproteobacteria bacterium]|nr:dephospho-CoA kinase [Zetaproteobacteria bacterium]